jgi:hypothetical protein
VALEPVRGEPGDLLERAGFLKWVRGAGNGRELASCAHPALRLTVELDHDVVTAADDQLYRRPHVGEAEGREVRAPPARDDGADIVSELGGGPQRGAGAGTGAEVDATPRHGSQRSGCGPDANAERCQRERSRGLRAAPANGGGLSFDRIGAGSRLFAARAAGRSRRPVRRLRAACRVGHGISHLSARVCRGQLAALRTSGAGE